MNDWGQGAKNNDSGWGQGAANNTTGWGASHFVSWSPDTNLTGLEAVLTLAFEARILADSGIFEAKSCLVTQIQSLV